MAGAGGAPQIPIVAAVAAFGAGVPTATPRLREEKRR
jgi:hypothetical protein